MTCACGCGLPTKPYTRAYPSKGIAEGDYARYIQGHNRKTRDRALMPAPPPPRPTIRERYRLLHAKETLRTKAELREWAALSIVVGFSQADCRLLDALPEFEAAA